MANIPGFKQSEAEYLIPLSEAYMYPFGSGSTPVEFSPYPTGHMITSFINPQQWLALLQALAPYEKIIREKVSRGRNTSFVGLFIIILASYLGFKASSNKYAGIAFIIIGFIVICAAGRYRRTVSTNMIATIASQGPAIAQQIGVPLLVTAKVHSYTQNTSDDSYEVKICVVQLSPPHPLHGYVAQPNTNPPMNIQMVSGPYMTPTGPAQIVQAPGVYSGMPVQVGPGPYVNAPPMSGQIVVGGLYMNPNGQLGLPGPYNYGGAPVQAVPIPYPNAQSQIGAQGSGPFKQY